MSLYWTAVIEATQALSETIPWRTFAKRRKQGPQTQGLESIPWLPATPLPERQGLLQFWRLYKHQCLYQSKPWTRSAAQECSWGQTLLATEKGSGPAEDCMGVCSSSQTGRANSVQNVALAHELLLTTDQGPGCSGHHSNLLSFCPSKAQVFIPHKCPFKCDKVFPKTYIYIFKGLH